MTEKLRPRHALFVEEYLKDLSASDAARRAGYSEKAASAVGHQLLRKPAIAAAVEAAKAQRSARCQIDADTVLKLLDQMVRADIRDIVDDLGRFKPIVQWPSIWRQMLQACEVEERYEKAQNGEKKWDAAGRVVKVRFIDRLKALELLGRHVNVRAFQTTEVAVVD